MSDGPIRLACIVCDRSDYDGVDSLPLFWQEITKSEDNPDYDPEDADMEFQWWNHEGTCPECWDDEDIFFQEQDARRRARSER